ncbi:MAG: ABC transporter permease [Spirochaetia bacterium]|jgi:simple sugar transport system permease protein|nr:ABC transporter permease [Spirochaetia bacterium]
MDKRRLSVNGLFDIIRVVVAMLIAVAITVVIIFAVSKEPGTALFNLFIGPFLTKRHFFDIVQSAIPLMFTGCALAMIFKSGNFSLIGDASLYLGGVTTAALAVFVHLPPVIHPLFIIVAAGIVGAAIGAIPAILKVRYGANELVTSLMLNFVFDAFGVFIINTFLADRNAGTFASLKYDKSAGLGNMLSGTRLHWGLLVALGIVVLSYLIMERSTLGYKIKACGSNLTFAKHAGINTGMTIILAQVIGGAICGIGGATEQLGMFTRFIWADSPSYVWDGVIVTILARNNPKNIPLSAFFLAYLRIGADLMSRRSDVQNELVAVIQAIIILFVTAESFLAGMKQHMESRQALAVK